MTAVEARGPARAPGVELLGDLQGSGYDGSRHLVRRPGGQVVQLTALLHQLLGLLDGQRDEAQLAEALSERCGKLVDPDDVATLLAKLAPLGLLAGEGGAEPPPAPPSPLLALKLKKVIADPAATSRITRPFAVLFRPFVAVPMLVAFAVTCWWVLFRHGLAPAAHQAFTTPGLLLAVFAITVVSAGWHEFGHAAACTAEGATPGAMGAGLYLVWPAFYTDVSDSYRLSRWGRLVVDLGGLYFNAIVAVATAGLWIATRADALLLIVATQLLQMLRQLLPIVRADGYHVLADLTGVPDLFHHLGPTVKGLLPSRWGQPQPLRPLARWIVRAWVLVTVPLLAWMLLGAVLLLPRLVATAWLGARLKGHDIAAAVGHGDPLGVVAGALKLVALLLPLAAVLYQLDRFGRRGVRWVRAKTEGRPLARALSVLGAAGLAALLLAAWWPKGQYQPVRADERGTLGDALDPAALRGSPVGLRGVRPQTGYALVPRGGHGPSLLLVRDGDRLRSITTDGGRTGVAFPFELPRAPRPGDNQAVAVNTGDGTTVYDVAVALVWVRDGADADQRNEAYALASCQDCTTVAVAFQVVVVIGRSELVTPVNLAVAANGGCLRCSTAALAQQLVVTLAKEPPDEVKAKVQAALDRLRADLPSAADPVAEVQAVQDQVLQLLRVSPDVHADVAVATSASTTTTLARSATTSTTDASSRSDASTSTTRATTTSTSPATTAPTTDATTATTEQTASASTTTP